MSSKLPHYLLAWYQDHARELPWRGEKDPYKIWVSEIMLQQTRVDTVIPYYYRWMKRFPDLPSLANGSLHEVLATWEGLGYYQRARNMFRTASIVVAEYGGELPGDLARLKSLPGIGKYAAGAIASIAFGMDEPAIDGNIRRVLARLFDISEPVNSPQAEIRFQQLARQNLPKGKAGDFNQALMDLGALICTIRNPACMECPLTSECQAQKIGVQSKRPVRMPKVNIPHRIAVAAVILENDSVLLTQWPSNGLLGSLWKFPGYETMTTEDLKTGLRCEIQERLGLDIGISSLVGIYRQAYTHFRVSLHAYRCRLQYSSLHKSIQTQDCRWVTIDRLNEYPMGKLDRTIAKTLQKG